MRGKRFTKIILLMSVSLLALIAVQAIWIKFSLDIEEEQFDNRIQFALDGLVKDLDKSRMFNFFEESVALELHKDSIRYSKGKIHHNDSLSVEVLVSELLEHRKKINSDSAKSSIEEVDSDDRKQKQIIRIQHQAQIERSGDSNVKIVLHNSDSETALLKHELWVQEGNSNIDSLTDEIRKRSDLMNELIEEMAIEYTLSRVELKPDTKLIDSLLRANLTKHNIQSAFQYQILQNNESQEKQNENLRSEKNKVYRASLKPKGLSIFDYNLLLSIDERNSIIRKGIWQILALALVFSALIILTFAYTLRTILKQKKISEIKNDFINNMTHEFKTPLATVNVALDAMESEQVISKPDKLLSFTNIIREENKRMNEQVDMVLRSAKSTREELGLDLKKTKLNEILEAAISHIRLQVESREGSIFFSPGAEMEIEADATHLQNAFLNILDNANKYCSQNPRIVVNTSYADHFAVIDITDNGIGMDRQTQKKVFDKFYRLSTGNLHNVKGFGLGLSYVHSVIQAHGGHIELKSSLGKGSSFRIKLPLV